MKQELIDIEDYHCIKIAKEDTRKDIMMIILNYINSVYLNDEFGIDSDNELDNYIEVVDTIIQTVYECTLFQLTGLIYDDKITFLDFVNHFKSLPLNFDFKYLD